MAKVVYTISFLAEKGGFIGEVWGAGLHVVHTTPVAPDSATARILVEEATTRLYGAVPPWVAFEPHHLSNKSHETRHEIIPAYQSVEDAIAPTLERQ